MSTSFILIVFFVPLYVIVIFQTLLKLNFKEINGLIPYIQIQFNITKNITSTDPIISFQDCPEAAKMEVDRLYKSNPNNTAHEIDQEKFAKYWKGIEERFNCTGWCKTSFINPITQQKQKMLNFVFSDINKGIPKYPGCLNRLVNWLPRLILAVGCCLIFAAFIQSLNMAFAIGLMAKPFDEDNAYANKNIERETKQLNPKKE